MNAPSNDEEDQGEVFLDESNIIQEITVDEEGYDSLSPPHLLYRWRFLYVYVYMRSIF